MSPMQARHTTPLWATQLRPGRLLLWLAAVLFVLQVPLHVSTPAGMSMAEHLAAVMSGSSSIPVTHAKVITAPTAPAPAMNGMPGVGHGTGHGQHPPGHHEGGLCCMSPLALLPLTWTPPLLHITRRVGIPPKAIREALRILRATARGPPPIRKAARVPLALSLMI